MGIGFQNWGTPPAFFNTVFSSEGPFPNPAHRPLLDVCAEPWSARAFAYFTDALSRPWSKTWWCNPPFGQIKKFLRHAQEQNTDGVFLLPANVDTVWFHETVMPGTEWWVSKGRTKFVPPPPTESVDRPRGGVILARFGGAIRFGGTFDGVTGRVLTRV